MPEDNVQNEAVLQLTANIVSAHVGNTSTPVDQLPGLIQNVYETLNGLGKTPPAAEAPIPAVPVKQSVRADYIICLEDGKKLKMLKRHLMTSYKMTPEDYRRKWGLPHDYPMVAPNYAEVRSGLAKKIGLGKISKAPAEASEAPAKKKAAPKKAAAKNAAPKKTTAKKKAAPKKKAAAAPAVE